MDIEKQRKSLKKVTIVFRILLVLTLVAFVFVNSIKLVDKPFIGMAQFAVVAPLVLGTLLSAIILRSKSIKLQKMKKLS